MSANERVLVINIYSSLSHGPLGIMKHKLSVGASTTRERNNTASMHQEEMEETKSKEQKTPQKENNLYTQTEISQKNSQAILIIRQVRIKHV